MPPNQVFITGIPRCGSSWVGEVLGSSANARYVYEPFNFQWVPALRGHLRHFKYLGDQSEAPAILQTIANDAFRGRQNFKQISRAIYRGYLKSACQEARWIVVKDPTAALMTAWIAARFQAKVLIVTRHPCGFASSLESMDARLNVNALLRQEELMQHHLEPFRDTMNQARKDKWLTRGAIWGAIHTVFMNQLGEHTDWNVCKYEDLCIDPARQFLDLTKTLGLETSQVTLKKIRGLNKPGDNDAGSTRRESAVMPKIWHKRMSPGEIDAVKGMVQAFGLEIYKD